MAVKGIVYEVDEPTGISWSLKKFWRTFWPEESNTSKSARRSWAVLLALVMVVVRLTGCPAMALLGALGAQSIRGLQNDVFCQVGLVMLVGLSSKNAILIVEFAEQLRERGVPLVEAAVQSAAIRLRPILMTSLAFILGVVPLVVATGAGENGRHSVGTTVFGGMIM